MGFILLKGDQLTRQVAGYFFRVLVHELRRGRQASATATEVAHMVCTAGIAPGCGVDSALCPIRVSSGLTAERTRLANQLVIALLT
jgi:hypothetical protein